MTGVCERSDVYVILQAEELRPALFHSIVEPVWDAVDPSGAVSFERPSIRLRDIGGTGLTANRALQLNIPSITCAHSSTSYSLPIMRALRAAHNRCEP